jgi:hypothetical protein
LHFIDKMGGNLLFFMKLGEILIRGKIRAGKKVI